jgi:hypothetical protein
MPKLHKLAALVAALTMLVVATAAAAPVTLNLRVEGPTSTIYEGPLTTDVHQLDAPDNSTNVHALRDCDGVHNGAPQNPQGYPSAAPTATSALDDGARQNAFTWNGRWFSSLNDILVDNVGPDAPAAGTYWTFLINWRSDPDHGGCQDQVRAGDDLVWATWDFTGPFLQLSGTPTRAATGEAFAVTVKNQDGAGNATPSTGASVGGQTTDTQGHAEIAFQDAGLHQLKATQQGAIRSNGETVCVYAPGSGDCGTDKPTDGGGQPPTTSEPGLQPAPAVKDTTPPVVRVTSPEPGKDYARGPRVIAGQVDDAGGIGQVFLRLRSSDGGGLTAASRCHWFSGKRGVFTHRTVPCSKARFFRIGTTARFSYLLPARLRTGRYVLDVKVLDKAYNAGRMAVPFRVK